MHIQNSKHCAGHCRSWSDFQPLADHMSQLRNFTKDEIRQFSFSLYLKFDQTFIRSNVRKLI